MLKKIVLVLLLTIILILAFRTSSTPLAAIFGAFTPFIVIIALVLALTIWNIKKLNRIEEQLEDIQEKLKNI